MLDTIAKSLGIPTRVFAGGDNLSGSRVAMLEQAMLLHQQEMSKVYCNNILKPMLRDWWFKSHRVKHQTVGQNQRDFWHALAKISKVEQIGYPKVVMSDA